MIFISFTFTTYLINNNSNLIQNHFINREDETDVNNAYNLI